MSPELLVCLFRICETSPWTAGDEAARSLDTLQCSSRPLNSQKNHRQRTRRAGVEIKWVITVMSSEDSSRTPGKSSHLIYKTTVLIGPHFESRPSDIRLCLFGAWVAEVGPGRGALMLPWSILIYKCEERRGGVHFYSKKKKKTSTQVPCVLLFLKPSQDSKDPTQSIPWKNRNPLP